MYSSPYTLPRHAYMKFKTLREEGEGASGATAYYFRGTVSKQRERGQEFARVLLRSRAVGPCSASSWLEPRRGRHEPWTQLAEWARLAVILTRGRDNRLASRLGERSNGLRKWKDGRLAFRVSKQPLMQAPCHMSWHRELHRPQDGHRCVRFARRDFESLLSAQCVSLTAPHRAGPLASPSARPPSKRLRRAATLYDNDAPPVTWLLCDRWATSELRPC